MNKRKPKVGLERGLPEPAPPFSVRAVDEGRPQPIDPSSLAPNKNCANLVERCTRGWSTAPLLSRRSHDPSDCIFARDKNTGRAPRGSEDLANKSSLPKN